MQVDMCVVEERSATIYVRAFEADTYRLFILCHIKD